MSSCVEVLCCAFQANADALFGDDSGQNGCPLRYANSERCGRFSGLEKSAAFRHPQSTNVLSNDHHNSFRYCSDPCRASADVPGGSEPGSFQSSASESSRPAETSAKMVVYEDDYLKPKSLQLTSNYLELTDGSSEPGMNTNISRWIVGFLKSGFELLLWLKFSAVTASGANPTVNVNVNCEQVHWVLTQMEEYQQRKDWQVSYWANAVKNWRY